MRNTLLVFEPMLTGFTSFDPVNNHSDVALALCEGSEA